MRTLADVLLDTKLVTRGDIERASSTAFQTNVPLSAAITRMGMVEEDSLAELVSKAWSLPRLNGSQLTEKSLDLAGLNPDFARAHSVAVFDPSDEAICAAVVDPSDEVTLRGIAFATGKSPQIYIATETDIRQFHERAGSAPSTDEERTQTLAPQFEDLDAVRDTTSNAPAIALVRQLIGDAVDSEISDIHVEPQDKSTVVRFRKDGALAKTSTLDQGIASQAISRIKVMANLDIAEKRLPQDGRIRATVRGRKLDLRVATNPTIHGEGIVLRLLGGNQSALDLSALGLSPHRIKDVEDAITQPNGVILVTGPTGSGKTTTLYAALRKLNQVDTKILTVEDPIEYLIQGINQVQVKPEIGLTYARALRSFLRQDPDVMMVGEIRDRETGDIAIRAALTGHLVLSTLHTNSAIGAINRLRDMGLESFLIASTLRLTSAQRLVRRLCPACRTERAAYASEREVFQRQGLDVPEVLYHAPGCNACHGTGVSGRVPIMETVPIGPELEAMIADGAGEFDLQAKATALGHTSLYHDGLERVRHGDIALAELERVLR